MKTQEISQQAARKEDIMFKQLLTITLAFCVIASVAFNQSVYAGPILNPANGHYYDEVAGPVNWPNAKAGAEALTFMGVQGHLATITSQDETDFIVNNLLSFHSWIGGFQPPGSPEPDGNWQWVTGEPFVYTNWDIHANGEPNNWGGNESALMVYSHEADRGQWNDESEGRTLGYIVEYPIPTGVTCVIDIKPGSDPNCFNNDGKGVIPVAILGSADLDVSEIDASTVELESMAVKAVGKSNKLLAHIEDVNEDGFDDLVVQIEDSDCVFSPGDTTATVTGNLSDGTPFEGTDTICIVGASSPAPRSNARPKLTTTWASIKSKH
jgi:hypothetical protein